MTGVLFTGAFYTAEDGNGVPISGAMWYFYEAGAYSTAKDTYTDYELTTPHDNPVVADANGRFAAIYLDGAYAGVLKDASGVTIKSILNINNENDTASNALTTVNTQTGTGYTLVLGDANGKVIMDNASANTLTVPPNSSVAFDIGTSVIVEQGGAGQTTIAAGAGVTINTAGTLLIDRQYANIAITKNDTNEWTITGQYDGSLVNSTYESDITAIESDLVIITSDILALETAVTALQAGDGSTVFAAGTGTSANGSTTSGSVNAVTVASVEIPTGGTLIARGFVDAYNTYSTGNNGVTTVKLLHNGTAIATWTNPGADYTDLNNAGNYGYLGINLSGKTTTAATGDLVLQVNGAASPYTLGYYNAFLDYTVLS